MYHLHSILFYIHFRRTARWVDNRILYEVSPLIFQVPPRPTAATVVLRLRSQC